LATGLLWLACLFVGVALARADSGAPGTVTIASATHPDPSLWYPSTSPKFTWTAATPFESGSPIAGYSFVLDKNPNTLPAVTSGGGTLSFVPKVDYTVGPGPAEDRVADLSNNGIEDIIAENAASNTVSVLMGKGDGTFQPAVNYTTGTNPWSLDIGDVNGDGNLDIVTCNEAANSVSVLLGNGDGTFKPAVDYSTGPGTSPECMRLGDITGDGSLDIVTANAGTNNISVLLNKGDGTFGTPRTFDTPTHPTSIAIGDLNGDERQDIVTANYATNNVSVLLGNGDGTFQAAVNYDCAAQPETVALADLRGDGRLDVVTANYSNSVSVLLNTGAGLLAPHVDYATGAGPYSLDIADLNHDGVPDVVTTNHAASTVSVLFGVGDGTLTPKTDLATGNGPFWVALGDFNGNGYGDLAVTNETDGTVSVFIGNAYFRPTGSALAASFTGKTNGVWYYHVRPVDSLGTGGPTTTFAVQIDTTSPTATDNIAGGWQTTAQQVTIADADTGGSGLAQLVCTLDSNPVSLPAGGGSFTVSSNGQHTITYYAVDGAGNQSAPVTKSLWIDRSAPVTTATPSATGWTNGDVTVTLAASDTGGSGLDKTYWKIDNGTPQIYAADHQPVLTSSSQVLTYWSTDLAGNKEGDQTLQAQIDRTPPVTSASPSPTGWTNGPVTVTLAASDTGGSGLDKTYWTIDGGTPQIYAADHQPLLTDSSQTLTYWSTDVAGNKEGDQTLQAQIDRSAPITTIGLAGTQGDNGWYTGPVTVTLTADDGSGSGMSGAQAVTQYSTDGGTTWNTYGAPFTVGSDGTTTLACRSTDAVGNHETSHDLTLHIDQAAPTATISSTSPSGWIGASSATFAWSGRDKDDLTPSDQLVYSWQLDTGGWSNWTSATSVTLTSLADGAHSFALKARDLAGNIESPVTRSFAVDTTAPSLSAVADPSGWTRGDVTMTLTAADDGSGIDQASFTAAVTGPAGASATATLSTATQDPDTGVWTAPVTVHAPAGTQGAYTVRLTASDAAGNPATTTAQALIDTALPVTTTADLAADDQSDWQSGPVQVTLDATGLPAGVASSTFYEIDAQGFQPYSGPFTVTGEGSHTVTCYSIDALGNSEAPHGGYVNIDSAPPTSTATGLQPDADSGWRKDAQSVSLSADDGNGSGVAAIRYTVDGTSQPDYTGAPFVVAGDGSHAVGYYAVDVAGNAETPAHVGYVNIDDLPPVTVAGGVTASAQSGYLHGPQKVTLVATDAGCGVQATYYALDGGAALVYGGPFEVSGVGSHALTYYSVDRLGNTEVAHKGYVNIAPDTALVTAASGLASTANSGWRAGAATVTLTPSGGGGVVTTRYRIDNGSWQNYAAPFVVAAGSGSHSIDYASSDSLGDAEQPSTGYVNIDTTAPVTIATGPTTPQRTATMVHFSASDAQSGVARTCYRIDAKAWQIGATAIVGAPAKHSMDGVHTITYYSVDAAGNAEASRQFKVTIDTTPPLFSLRTARRLAVRKGRYLTLRYRAVDARGTGKLLVTIAPKAHKQVHKASYALPTRWTRKWQKAKLRMALRPGTYVVRLRLVDAAGNLSVTRSVSVTIR
jgi:hypothetical protein